MPKETPVLTVVPPKTGFLSSEFVVHLIVMAIGLAMTLLPTNPWVQSLGGVVTVLSGSHYTIHRGKLKAMAYQVGLAAYVAALKVYTTTDEDGNPLPNSSAPLPNPIPAAGDSSTPSPTSSATPSGQPLT